MKRKKCIIVGLDGASFDIINPLMERGLIPCMKYMMENGAHGELASTIPCQTPVAWTSYATGVNPAKHGIFGWWRPEGSRLIPESGAQVVAARFWEILSASGFRVGVVNVPMSYPARPVAGFMISGFDSPFSQPALNPWFSYPRNLLAQLGSMGVDYKIMPPKQSRQSLMEAAKLWYRVEESRIEAAVRLFEQFDPDFLQVNLFYTDYFAHRSFQAMEVLDFVYASADSLVQRLHDLAGPDDLFLVISDHGSCAISTFVMTHNLLSEAGLLRFHPWIADENLKLIFENENHEGKEFERLQERIERGGPEVRAQLYREVEDKYPGANIGFGTIDWDETKAYTLSDYGQIWLNRKRGRGARTTRRQYLEVVEQVTDLFLRLPAAAGGRVVSDVLGKEKIYHGPFAERAPDLTPLIQDYSHYFCQAYSFYARGERRIVCPVREVVDPVEAGCAGDHNPFGILLATGPAVSPGCLISKATILDVAPTILSFFGIEPLPEYDGEVLGALLGGASTTRNSSLTANEIEDANLLRQRLLELGYRL